MRAASPRLKCTSCYEIAAGSVHNLPARSSNRGRVIKELNFRRSDIIVTTKIFWGTRRGPNDMGLSRKQWVYFDAGCPFQC